MFVPCGDCGRSLQILSKHLSWSGVNVKGEGCHCMFRRICSDLQLVCNETRGMAGFGKDHIHKNITWMHMKQSRNGVT